MTLQISKSMSNQLSLDIHTGPSARYHAYANDSFQTDTQTAPSSLWQYQVERRR